MDQFLKETLAGMAEVARVSVNSGLEMGVRDERARVKPLIEALELCIQQMTAPAGTNPDTGFVLRKARDAIAAYQREGK